VQEPTVAVQETGYRDACAGFVERREERPRTPGVQADIRIEHENRIVTPEGSDSVPPIA
jgi:hypothetical protein